MPWDIIALAAYVLIGGYVCDQCDECCAGWFIAIPFIAGVTAVVGLTIYAAFTEL